MVLKCQCSTIQNSVQKLECSLYLSTFEHSCLVPQGSTDLTCVGSVGAALWPTEGVEPPTLLFHSLPALSQLSPGSLCLWLFFLWVSWRLSSPAASRCFSICRAVVAQNSARAVVYVCVFVERARWEKQSATGLKKQLQGYEVMWLMKLSRAAYRTCAWHMTIEAKYI